MSSPSVKNVPYSSTTERSGGSSSSSVSTQTPYQQAHYDQLLGQANNLYQQGLPEYYSGPTVAGFTPAQLEAFNQASNWATGGGQDMIASMNKTYQDMMSGRVNTGAGSPYGDMIKSFQNQAVDSAQDVMGQLRGSQVMSGQYGGSSRGDMLNNRVIEEANKQVTDATSRMYMDAYNQAQNKQLGALGQYGSIMNMPMSLAAQLYNQVGLPQQQLNQNLMDAAKARYDYNSMLPFQNLQMYQNFIGGNMGGTTTTQSSSSSGGTSTTTGTKPVVGSSPLDTIQKVAGIAGTIAAISDERLKDDIQPIGRTAGGIKLYRWKWNQKAKDIGVTHYPTVGVIAQEIQKIKPEAILQHESGYLMVDYAQV